MRNEKIRIYDSSKAPNNFPCCVVLILLCIKTIEGWGHAVSLFFEFHHLD